MTYHITVDHLGTIYIKTARHYRRVRFYITPKGQKTITAPLMTPKLFIKHFIKSNRVELQSIIDQHKKHTLYTNNMTLTPVSSLIITHSNTDTIHAGMHHNNLTISLPKNIATSDETTQNLIRKEVLKLVKQQAQQYLPRRLKKIATQHNLTYKKVRITHTSTRWGSCSSTGTISLNMALMRCTLDEIDYVLCHELAHTVHMNHSSDFWNYVASLNPQYKKHEKSLKNKSPSM